MKDLVSDTARHVRAQLTGESSGHDWWHVERVWKLACTIADSEQSDRTTVELAALLHDVADWKFNDGDHMAGVRHARAWLESLGAPEPLIVRVCEIVEHVSFMGAGVADEMPSREGQIVQDADRLDAIGAVGIARVFAFGGHAGRPIHDPDERPQLHGTPDAYKASRSSSITHFHEKLLLLRDRMHTDTGRRLAEGRHQFMVTFLDEFSQEWEGKR